MRVPFTKRVLDVAIAGTALAIGAPIIAGAALAVWLDVGRPIVFRQERGGFGGSAHMRVHQGRNFYKSKSDPEQRNDRSDDDI